MKALIIDIKTLEHRGLLDGDRKTPNKYDLHPIVRRYVYERLTAATSGLTHTHVHNKIF